MLQFLKFVLATVVGLLFFFVLSALILAGIGASASRQTVEVENNSVLWMKLNRPINERGESDDPFTAFAFGGRDNMPLGLVEIRRALARAKDDSKIEGIYLDLSFLPAGYASVEEIRNALLDFKTSGKFIVAYGEAYTEKAYYLASVADRIFLNPVGALEFNGLYQETAFLKGTLEKLDVKPEVFRVGDFKSAVEPFLREDMSEENRLQTRSFLNSIYDHLIAGIAEARGLSAPELRQLSDSMRVQTPEDALEYQLITDLGYFDEVEAAMRERLELEDDKKIEYIALSKYIKADDNAAAANITSRDRVAVLVAEGNIVSGEGDNNSIGSDAIARQLRKLRRDDKVKAVVLRINSPGGSALASDVMWREIGLLRQQKPVIASMSDVAASGGYYMAMGCDTIVAHPNTITGSIGVFGLLFNAEAFLKNKLGVTADRVKTGAYSDLGNPTRALTDFERQLIQRYVDTTYEQFTRKAAEGRGMTQDNLKAVASGRVWSGREALDKGLVDVLGGLEDAIVLAATAAGLEEDAYRVRYYPEQKSFLEQILDDGEEQVKAHVLRTYLGEYYPYARAVEQVRKWEGIQTRLPYDVEIH